MIYHIPYPLTALLQLHYTNQIKIRGKRARVVEPEVYDRPRLLLFCITRQSSTTKRTSLETVNCPAKRSTQLIKTVYCFNIATTTAAQTPSPRANRLASSAPPHFRPPAHSRNFHHIASFCLSATNHHHAAIGVLGHGYEVFRESIVWWCASLNQTQRDESTPNIYTIQTAHHWWFSVVTHRLYVRGGDRITPSICLVGGHFERVHASLINCVSSRVQMECKVHKQSAYTIHAVCVCVWFIWCTLGIFCIRKRITAYRGELIILIGVGD